jgi:hypothetical protein
VVGDFLRKKSHNVALGQSESFCFECKVGNKISLCFLVIKVAPQRLVYIRSCIVSTQYSPTVVQASEETHTFAPGRVLTRHDTSQLWWKLKTMFFTLGFFYPFIQSSGGGVNFFYYIFSSGFYRIPGTG